MTAAMKTDNHLTIKDNTPEPQKNFDVIPALTSKIADKKLSDLESEGVLIFPLNSAKEPSSSGEQRILRSNGSDYLSGNIMGFLGLENERLVITSCFAGNDSNAFLHYLLTKGPAKGIDLPTDASQEERILNLPLLLFPDYLRRALRKGIFKTYIRHHYNDSKVRGTIDIARHIARNIPFIGNVAYSRREYSDDNYLMELVRHTIEFIKRKFGNRILAGVRDEAERVREATPKYDPCDKMRVVAENVRMPVRHAYYHEYRDLQRLCIWILKQAWHRPGSGSHRIYGVLFDGAWLWEEYVAELISELFHHPDNRRHRGTQHLFTEQQNNKKEPEIYPDFISKDKERRIIADAKYKKKLKNSDYQQLLAYMFRFDAKKGYLLYPEKQSKEDVVYRLNRGSTYDSDVSPREDVTVVNCGLVIPQDVGDYGAFRKEMQANEQAFIKRIT
ncbi:MAG: McrC family protein [Akkermansiaceae bacterium]|nr:McrC family protein [Akkermansiaceae bacterium]